MIRKSVKRFSEKSCSNKELKRDDDSTQSHRALGGVDSRDSLLRPNQIQGFFWEAALGVMDRLVLSDAAWERMAP
ncbi:hypothetical protein, partial [Bradyrhizobium pachyrhizi]|uniref:hypothetical protein n=1 Tax=Bradyrhizobium pachyrhizi TaxID=280333 RepID=UPI001AEEB4CD